VNITGAPAWRRAGLATTVVALGWLATDAASTAQQPAFRATVDLVAVDVQVVDGNGRPLTALDKDKFEVTIDGRKRRVLTSDFVQNAIVPADPAARPLGTGPTASNVWTSAERADRTYILAVDAGSFDASEAIQVIQAARGFVDQLQARDFVGVFTLPTYGPRVEPTADRASIRRALDGITGRRQTITGQFNLSSSEIIDILASPASLGGSPLRTPAPTGARGAPAPPPIVSDVDVLQRVQIRECRNTSDQACLQAIVSEASSLALHLEERARQSLIGLGALLDALRQHPGRKTVVMLSAGIALSDRPGGRIDIGTEAVSLGEQAAHANATIYALHIDQGHAQSFSAQSRRTRDPGSLARERALSSKLLDEFAQASGGALLPVSVGSGEIALGRVLRETSAYYLLGVEPVAADRDGKAHRLRVKVSERGATVRSRQWVVLPRVKASLP
jgi:VWFA-related protein